MGRIICEFTRDNCSILITDWLIILVKENVNRLIPNIATYHQMKSAT